MKKALVLTLAVILSLTISAQTTVSDMLENTLSSVVTVAVYKTGYANKTLGYRGGTLVDKAYERALILSGATGSGSGFVILKNGKKYVITNAHVVQDASDERGSIYIFSLNGTKYEMKIVGGDSFYDIAVLEFVTTPGIEITTVDFKKTEPRIGETVYAIGNPLGEYPYSVSNGIISAKNRVREGFTGKFGFLQTTATIIWGNSGGPLVDQFGKVAGINTKICFAKSPTGDDVIQSQINFAIEAKLAERIINDIVNNNGRVKRAYLGVEFSKTSTYTYASGGKFTFVPKDTLPVLTGVVPGSPAATILTPYIGWVVTHVGTVEVRNLEELLGEFEKTLPNSSVEFTLVSGAEKKKVIVKSTELLDQELENIASYVIDAIGKLKIVEKMPQITVTVNKENSYTYKDNKFNNTPKNQSMNSAQTDQKYNVLAAGIVGDGYQSMWKTDQLKYMGAALKLCGLAGVIDLYLLKPYDKVENIEVVRYYLSGSESSLKSSLWY